MNKLEGKPFAVALDHVLRTKIIKNMTQKKLAEDILVSPQYISFLRKGYRTGTEEIRRAIAEKFGFEYEKFLNLGRSIISMENKKQYGLIQAYFPSEPDQKPCLKLITHEPTHEDVIQRFKDKDTAKLLNSMLADIEDVSPDDYETVKAVIKSVHDRIIEKKTENHGSNS